MWQKDPSYAKIVHFKRWKEWNRGIEKGYRKEGDLSIVVEKPMEEFNEMMKEKIT